MTYKKIKLKIVIFKYSSTNEQLYLYIVDFLSRLSYKKYHLNNQQSIIVPVELL